MAVTVGYIADELIAKLILRVKDIAIDHGLNEDADMGPWVTSQHYDKVKDYVDLGVAEGAKLVIDGCYDHASSTSLLHDSTNAYDKGYF